MSVWSFRAAANKGVNPSGFLIATLTDTCGLLLANGSNVNEVEPNTKHTALHYAVLNGHNVLVEALLSWGAHVNQQDYHGSTPLHVACQEGHLLCVLTLLKARANLTLPTNWGGLPIHIAATTNRVEIVRTLLEHGCSPDTVGWNINKQLSSSLFLSAQHQEWADTIDVRSNSSIR